MRVNHICDHIPKEKLSQEQFDQLIQGKTCKLKRIISTGHTTPKNQWYDQPEDEWVMVIQGAAKLQFTDNDEITLKPGDYLHIPAHCKHRVSWTDPEQPTVWLALYYIPDDTNMVRC